MCVRQLSLGVRYYDEQIVKSNVEKEPELVQRWVGVFLEINRIRFLECWRMLSTTFPLELLWLPPQVGLWALKSPHRMRGWGRVFIRLKRSDEAIVLVLAGYMYTEHMVIGFLLICRIMTTMAIFVIMFGVVINLNVYVFKTISALPPEACKELGSFFLKKLYLEDEGTCELLK